MNRHVLTYCVPPPHGRVLEPHSLVTGRVYGRVHLPTYRARSGRVCNSSCPKYLAYLPSPGPWDLGWWYNIHLLETALIH